MLYTFNIQMLIFTDLLTKRDFIQMISRHIEILISTNLWIRNEFYKIISIKAFLSIWKTSVLKKLRFFLYFWTCSQNKFFSKRSKQKCLLLDFFKVIRKKFPFSRYVDNNVDFMHKKNNCFKMISENML